MVGLVAVSGRGVRAQRWLVTGQAMGAVSRRPPNLLLHKRQADPCRSSLPELQRHSRRLQARERNPAICWSIEQVSIASCE